jgi:antitoxin component YwqK of YwqJK toxin-antitoxin module
MRCSLDLIIKKYKPFMKPEYVYKMCYGKTTNKWIIIMDKLLYTDTNEDRKNMIDIQHAKYRASDLRVIKIINIFSLKSIKKITHHTVYCGDKTVYWKNHVVLPSNPNIFNEISIHGILYYKSIEAAYYYGNPENNYTGRWFKWFDDGSYTEFNIIKGRKHGLALTRYYNGSKCLEYFYVYDKLHGLFRRWHENGNLAHSGRYQNNHMISEIEYNEDGEEINTDL